MARQDIEIDTEYGELQTADNIVGKQIYDFKLFEHINGEDNENYCYSEITIPMNQGQRVKDGLEAHIHIAYHPICKRLKVRFRVEMNSEQFEYILNPTNNSMWYDVELIDGSEIHLAEFRYINEDNYYKLRLEKGALHIYSGKETDLRITPALSQNQSFLLKSSAGTLYQHPLTGVGLIDFLHGNFENSGLATRLQREFESDNMVVINAYMDSESGELLLEVREKNG